jgi:hypothetical protein
MEMKKPQPLPRSPSLYTSVGGTLKLEEVVKRWAALAKGSTELRPPLRQALQDDSVQEHLVRLLGGALGGPYPGTLDDLRRFFASPGAAESPQEMATLLGLLEKAMQESGEGPRTTKDVMTALAPLRTAPTE